MMTRAALLTLFVLHCEDPDVILVGKMRDLESIQLAVSAAETGHLLRHCTPAPAQTVDRMVDVFPSSQ